VVGVNKGVEQNISIAFLVVFWVISAGIHGKTLLEKGVIRVLRRTNYRKVLSFLGLGAAGWGRKGLILKKSLASRWRFEINLTTGLNRMLMLLRRG